MNGIDSDALMTIHVTPEAGFSYASCELHSFATMPLRAAATTADIVRIFQPGRFVVACSYPAHANIEMDSMRTFERDSAERFAALDDMSVSGYARCGVSTSELACGSRVVFCSFERLRTDASDSGASEGSNQLRSSASSAGLSNGV